MTLIQNLKDGEGALEVARQLKIENDSVKERVAEQKKAVDEQGEAIGALVNFLESLVGETKEPELSESTPRGDGGVFARLSDDAVKTTQIANTGHAPKFAPSDLTGGQTDYAPDSEVDDNGKHF